MLSVWAIPASGQSIFKNAWSEVKNGAQNAWSDVKYGALDVGYVWTSPIRLSQRDLPALGMVAGATGVAFAFDDNLQDWLRAHPESIPVDAVRWFRSDKEGEELGDIWMFIRYSGAVWLVGLAVGSETLREAAVGCASAGVAQTFPRRIVMYNLVQRTRPEFTRDPYRFDVPGKKEWGQRSFFGGHAANAMTCITFWNHRFDLGLAEPVLYAAGIATGLARTVDEAHWTSDTVIGIAFGYAVGRTVALRQKARQRANGERVEEQKGIELNYLGDGRIAIGWRYKL
jgi:membrane-associated phospholipid phosphatase